MEIYMNKLIYAIFISLAFSIAVTAYSDGVQENLQDNLIRLHIIANSDSGEDQAIKLKVRDAILEKVQNELEVSDRDKIIENLSEIEETANRTLAENGFDYSAGAVYGKFAFPRKEYKNMTLPAGDYYGVRVVLGNGAGHNWWCVMYPPMCVADGAPQMDRKSEALLKESLSDEAYEIVTGTKKDVAVKFKAVELVQELRQKVKELSQ